MEAALSVHDDFSSVPVDVTRRRLLKVKQVYNLTNQQLGEILTGRGRNGRPKDLVRAFLGDTQSGKVRKMRQMEWEILCRNLAEDFKGQGPALHTFEDVARFLDSEESLDLTTII